MVSYGFSERPSKKNSANLRPPDVPTKAGHIHMHTQAESKHEPPHAQALTSEPAHTHVHMYIHTQAKGEKGLFSFPDLVAHFESHWWHRWFGSLAWSLKRDSSSNTTILEGFLTLRLFAAWARMVMEGLGTNIRHEILWQQWCGIPVNLVSYSCPLSLLLSYLTFTYFLLLPSFPSSFPSLLNTFLIVALTIMKF